MFKRAFVIFAIFISGITYSQEFSVGLKAGPTFADTWNQSGSFSDYVLRYSAGIFSISEVTELFAIQFEVNYELKGGELTEPLMNAVTGNTIIGPDGKEQYYTNRLNLQYISIPLLAKFYFVRDKPDVSLLLGPYAGILIKAEQRYLADYNSFGDKESIDQTEKLNGYHSLDIGVTAAAAFEIPLSEKFLLALDLRFNLGLKPIRDSEFGYPPKNVSFGLGGGLLYHF